MRPTLVQLLNAILAIAQEDEETAARADAISRKLDALRLQVTHVRQQGDFLRAQNALLVRLVRQLLEQTPDPAQIAALSGEIAQLEAASGQLTDAMEANP